MAESRLDLFEPCTQVGNIRLERGESLIELTVGKANQRPQLIEFLFDLAFEIDELASDSDNGFCHDLDLSPQLFGHDSKMTLDLVDGFTIHGTSNTTASTCSRRLSPRPLRERSECGAFRVRGRAV